MSADVTAINNRSGFVDTNLQRLKDEFPITALRPVVEAIVDAFPRPEALGQITPRQARLGAKEHRIYELPVADFGARPTLLLGYDRNQARPLLIC